MNSKTAADMIKKMKESIEHQAQTNKAQIEQDAEEQATSLRNKLVNNARTKIEEDELFSRKQIHDQLAVQLSIVNSVQKMKVLKARDEALNKAMIKAQESLRQYVKSPEYPDLLCNICVQSLLNLGEPNVEFALTENDGPIFDSKKNDILNLYKEKVAARNTERKNSSKSGNEISIEISRSSYVLPDAAIGGCVAIAKEGTIQCSNTFMDRLTLSCTDLYPRIKDILLEK